MGRTVDVDDLLDGVAVAELIGLTNPSGLSTYRARYADFPAPVWSGGRGRCSAWAREDVEQWMRDTGRTLA